MSSTSAAPRRDAFAAAVGDEHQALVARIGDLRRRADQLRELADRAESQASEEERYLRELESLLDVAPQLRFENVDRRLRGQRLGEVAVQILKRRQPHGEPIHYTEWFALLRAAGHNISGKDPLANFLAQVSRAPQVERVAPRSGLYRLRAA